MASKDKDLENALAVIFGATLVGVFSSALFVGCSYLLAWAWNAVLVPVAHLPAITSWQAFAILALLSIVRFFIGRPKK